MPSAVLGGSSAPVGADPSTVTSDLATRFAICSRRTLVARHLLPITAFAASSVNPAAKIPSRRSRHRSGSGSSS
jgi:hypothetical protein